MTQNLIETDARSAATLLSVLDWSIQRGLSAPGVFTPEQLTELRAVVLGERPWRSELYDVFRSLGYVCFRTDGAPPFNIGDVLEALRNAPLKATDLAPWPTQAKPHTEAFGRLGYTKTSEGISAVQRRNRDGWAVHAEKNKALTVQALSQFAGDSAVVLGAGKAYDVPLKALVARYSRLILVDVDLSALTETTQRVLGQVPDHVELVQQDVAGVSGVFLDRLEGVFSSGGNEQTHFEAAIEFLGSYHLDAPPRLFPAELTANGRVDSAYSLMLLSQLATPLTLRLRDAFLARYPGSKLYDHGRMQVALKRFTHAVQHDHVRSLMAASDTFILTSDLAEQVVRLGPAGRSVPVSTPLPIVGAERLDELVPQQALASLQNGSSETGSEPGANRRLATVLAATGWEWPRVVAKKPRARGSTMIVQGVAVNCQNVPADSA